MKRLSLVLCASRADLLTDGEAMCVVWPEVFQTVDIFMNGTITIMQSCNINSLSFSDFANTKNKLAKLTKSTLCPE